MDSLVVELLTYSPLLGFIAIVLLIMLKIFNKYMEFVNRVLDERSQVYDELKKLFERYYDDIWEETTKLKLEILQKTEKHDQASLSKIDKHDELSLRKLDKILNLLEKVEYILNIKEEIEARR